MPAPTQGNRIQANQARRAALAATLAAALAGCAPMVVADTSDPCTPARRVFQDRSTTYLDISAPTRLPAGQAVSFLLQRASPLLGETDQDFDRLYAQSPDLPALDRAAADEIAARQSQVQALSAAWQDLAGCRRAQAAAQPGGRATAAARARHEEDLRTLRRTEEATGFWRQRYDRLRQRIAAMAGAPSNAATQATPLAAATFAATAATFSAAVEGARQEAATHFPPL